MDTTLTLVLVTATFNILVLIVQRVLDRRKTHSDVRKTDSDTISSLMEDVQDSTEHYTALKEKYIEVLNRQIQLESELVDIRNKQSERDSEISSLRIEVKQLRTTDRKKTEQIKNLERVLYELRVENTTLKSRFDVEREITNALQARITAMKEMFDSSEFSSTQEKENNMEE